MKSIFAQIASAMVGVSVAYFFIFGKPEVALGWVICTVALLAVSHNLK
jgi:hypothetical protein